MQKIKVHELAKELNVPSKEIMKRLEEMGIFVPSHMSALQPAEEDKIRVAFGGKPVHQRPVVKKRVIVRKRVEAPAAEQPAAESRKQKPKCLCIQSGPPEC